jgi:hypothetical protein
LELFICLASLSGYDSGDHEDLSILDLEHATRIVGRDGRTSDLEHEVIQGRLTVDMSVMRHYERLTKLHEHTTLTSRVFGVLRDRARVIKMTFADSTKWDHGSRFDLDLILHVARCYVTPQVFIRVH